MPEDKIEKNEENSEKDNKNIEKDVKLIINNVIDDIDVIVKKNCKLVLQFVTSIIENKVSKSWSKTKNNVKTKLNDISDNDERSDK